MVEDAELLRRYAEEKSERAFAELVERESLRKENARRRGLAISPAELEAPRAEPAALPRLRAEFEALSKPAPAVGRSKQRR